MKYNITQIAHPDYIFNEDDWCKWKLAYNGGQPFIDAYLKKLTVRETDEDFALRKSISYCPAASKAAINEIKNSIFQRTIDISRVGGPESYQKAVKALDGGVDLYGSSMNSFIGRYILPELLVMKKVGVYVDMPPISGVTQSDKGNKRPYLYIYSALSIRSWSYSMPQYPNEFDTLLLCDEIYTTDDDTELPTGTIKRYRYMWKENGQVYLQFFNETGEPITPFGDLGEEVVELKLSSIPFVVFEIPSSLMTDISDMEIALLNLNSSDINYATRANFPFYVEQFDPRIETPYAKIDNPQDSPGEGTSADARNREYQVGVSHGRRYPKDTNQPNFIHPSPEPLKVAMEKEAEIKRDIRHAVNLAITNMDPKMASAESKTLDNQGLESGLSFIGLVLETGERLIAKHWSAYEGSKSIATINYPENYNLRSDAERQQEAEGKEKLMSSIPSNTFKRIMAKQITKILLGHHVNDETLEQIYKEIETAPAIISDPKEISEDWKNGFVSDKTASKLRGYEDGEVDKAKTDRAERIALVMEAQGGESGQARGSADFSDTQGGRNSSDEKQGKPKRGPNKLEE